MFSIYSVLQTSVIFSTWSSKQTSSFEVSVSQNAPYILLISSFNFTIYSDRFSIFSELIVLVVPCLIRFRSTYKVFVCGIVVKASYTSLEALLIQTALNLNFIYTLSRFSVFQYPLSPLGKQSNQIRIRLIFQKSTFNANGLLFIWPQPGKFCTIKYRQYSSRKGTFVLVLQLWHRALLFQGEDRLAVSHSVIQTVKDAKYAASQNSSNE